MKKTLLIASLGLLSMSLQTQAEELQEFTAKIPEALIQPVSSPR